MLYIAEDGVAHARLGYLSHIFYLPRAQDKYISLLFLGLVYLAFYTQTGQLYYSRYLSFFLGVYYLTQKILRFLDRQYYIQLLGTNIL